MRVRFSGCSVQDGQRLETVIVNEYGAISDQQAGHRTERCHPEAMDIWDIPIARQLTVYRQQNVMLTKNPRTRKPMI